MRAAAWLTVAAAAVAVVAVPPARAEDRPLLVVVEGAPDQARDLRRQIARETGKPVVALGDEGAERSWATLSLALSRDGRSAWVCYRNDDPPRYEELAAPQDAGRGVAWLAMAAAEMMRRAEANRGDWSIADEVIDPFSRDPRRTSAADMRLPPEIIDPWERPGRDVAASGADESGSLLGRPDPHR